MSCPRTKHVILQGKPEKVGSGSVMSPRLPVAQNYSQLYTCLYNSFSPTRIDRFTPIERGFFCSIAAGRGVS